MDQTWLRTANPDEERNKIPNMYIYLNITEPGTYEVRGLKGEITIEKNYSYDYTNFPGFMYDLDSNLSTENIILFPEIHGNGDARIREVLYRTMARESKFKLKEWGSYCLIGFMGEKYFAGYSNDRSNQSLNSISKESETNILLHEKLSKVLTDSDEELKPIAITNSIPLKEEYILIIKDIDPKGILLELRKNGSRRDTAILNLERNEDTYAYHAPINSEEKLITLAVHFTNLFNSRATSLVTVDGIWQISDNLTSVEYGSSNGIMTIKDVDANRNMTIKMKSEDNTIRATKGDENIMGDYFIRFADQDPLRFYIMKKVIVGGGSD
jgi:S-layer protein (TIGR01567 family)